LAPNRADLNSEAICKARHQVVFIAPSGSAHGDPIPHFGSDLRSPRASFARRVSRFPSTPHGPDGFHRRCIHATLAEPSIWLNVLPGFEGHVSQSYHKRHCQLANAIRTPVRALAKD
jgi:hypothetical protein